MTTARDIRFSPRQLFRFFAFSEAVTWTLLLGGLGVRAAFGVVPYATIPFEIRAEKAGQLAGAWRRIATSDPRDTHWFDRLYRWFLNRPVFFALVLLAMIVAIFATLMSIGPPGGWPANED